HETALADLRGQVVQVVLDVAGRGKFRLARHRSEFPFKLIVRFGDPAPRPASGPPGQPRRRPASATAADAGPPRPTATSRPEPATWPPRPAPGAPVPPRHRRPRPPMRSGKRASRPAPSHRLRPAPPPPRARPARGRAARPGTSPPPARQSRERPVAGQRQRSSARDGYLRGSGGRRAKMHPAEPQNYNSGQFPGTTAEGLPPGARNFAAPRRSTLRAGRARLVTRRPRAPSPTGPFSMQFPGIGPHFTGIGASRAVDARLTRPRPRGRDSGGSTHEEPTMPHRIRPLLRPAAAVAVLAAATAHAQEANRFTLRL